MSQLKEITITTVSGGSQNIKLQDYESSKDIEYWFDNDVAISGKIRQNVRGSRGVYRLNYSQSTQPAVFRSIINNIIADLSNGNDSFSITDGSNIRVVTITEQFKQNIDHIDSIGTFVPDMEFIDAGINRLDGQYVEDGYVTAGYVE